MSNFPAYTTKTFSPTQKFFVIDPNTGNPAFVQGSDLVAQLTPNSNYVFSESTRTTAQATDYELGAVIQTGGATAVGDNLAGVYLVVPAGDGDFPMANGLDLLTLAGDDTLLERLALNTVGEGSDLVAHAGTDDTVTEALNKRTIYVGSVADLDSLSSGQPAISTDVDQIFVKQTVGVINSKIRRDHQRILRYPEGFDWNVGPGAGVQVYTRPLVVFKGHSGYEIEGGFDWTPANDLPAEANTAYINSSGGLLTALNDNTLKRIIIEPGIYLILDGWPTTLGHSELYVSVAGGGRAVILNGTRAFTWADEGGGIYSTTDADGDRVINCAYVRDRDEYGDYYPLTKRASLTELQSSDEGFYLSGSGLTLYTKNRLGANPVNELYCLFDKNAPTVTSGGRFYFENIDFLGGDNAFKCDTTTGTVVMRNCAFAYSSGNGVEADNMVNGIFLKRCRAYRNYADGFNYHDVSASTPCHAIEDHCKAYENGFNSGAVINNATTNHDNSRVIRVGGVYGPSYGPVIADIDQCQSWNIGCSAFESKTTTGVDSSWESWGNSGGVAVGASMWLDDCSGFDSEFDLYAHGNGKIYIRNVQTDLKYFVEGGTDSVIEEY